MHTRNEARALSVTDTEGLLAKIRGSHDVVFSIFDGIVVMPGFERSRPIKEIEKITREVLTVSCKYCSALIPMGSTSCPECRTILKTFQRAQIPQKNNGFASAILLWRAHFFARKAIECFLFDTVVRAYSMKELKKTDQVILAGLMKNSKISDRKLAKKMRVSQPTVTRRRKMLEKEVIDSYTIVPKWKALGLKLLVITFIKNRDVRGSEEMRREATKETTRWMMQHPNVLTCVGSRGMNWHGLMISVHRSYSAFEKFMTDHDLKLGKYLNDVENVIVNLEGDRILKPFDLKYLADFVQVQNG